MSSVQDHVEVCPLCGASCLDDQCKSEYCYEVWHSWFSCECGAFFEEGLLFLDGRPEEVSSTVFSRDELASGAWAEGKEVVVGGHRALVASRFGPEDLPEEQCRVLFRDHVVIHRPVKPSKEPPGPPNARVLMRMARGMASSGVQAPRRRSEGVVEFVRRGTIDTIRMQGYAKHMAEAARRCRMAAEKGDAAAAFALGMMYSTGDGVPKDLIQTHAWLKLGEARGNEDARVFLPLMEEQMTAEQIAEATELARDLLEKLQKE